MTLHERALELAKNYRRSEKELIGVLMQIDDQKVFRTLGFASLHAYCEGSLKLSGAQSYALINIARKSRQFPELKKAVEEEKISISNAVRIAAALTAENKNSWIEKAAILSKRKLGLALVKESPRPIPLERIKPLTETRLELRLAISLDLERKI